MRISLPLIDIEKITPILKNLKVNNLKGKIYGEIRIKDEIFQNPLFEISITGKDIDYQGYFINRGFLLLDGRDFSHLRIRNLSFKMGENYLIASGIWNLLKMEGEIKGNIQLKGNLDYLFSFLWKGDLNSWKGELTPRGTYLTLKNNFIIKRPKGIITIDNKGNIYGELKAKVLKGDINIKILGENWKWKIYGKGENLEKNLKSVELELNNELSFKGNLLLGYHGNTLGLKFSGQYRNGKISGDLILGEKNLGKIDLGIDAKGLNIKGNILGGEISGEIFLEETLKFNIRSRQISYQNITLKNLDIKGKIQEGIYLESISFSPFENTQVLAKAHISEFNNIDGNLDLIYKNRNIINGSFSGTFKDLNISGKFLGNEFLGNYSLKGLRLYGEKFKLYDQDLPVLKEFKGFIDKWDINISLNGIEFNLSSAYLEYQRIPIKNLSIQGSYKDKLSLNVKGNSYGIFWEIKGSGISKFDFYLSLNFLSVFNSVWKGTLELGEEMKVALSLREAKIPKIINGKMEGRIKEGNWNLEGDFSFVNNGNLRLTLDSYGKGKLKGKSFPLSILKDLNIIDISEEVFVDFNLNLKDYSIENGNLNIFNLNIPFLGRIESSLEIARDKEDYRIRGEIINFSKNKGLIMGKFNFNEFNFDITLPDSEFLYSYVPKDYIKDLDRGKIELNISGNFKQWISSGILLFSSPINIPYILDKISSIEFKLRNQENKILVESLNVKSFNSKITGSGELYPNLNLNLKLKNLVLNVPGLFQGYSEWDINFKDIEGPLIEGKVLIYNASISYSRGEEVNKELSGLPKIKLSLDLNLGENVNFYIPNTLNLSLKGNLKISGDLLKPLLNGKIDFSRGSIQVLNRNFSVDFGYIKFPGLSFEENIWEISGSAIIQNYLVFLKAYGFMGQSSVYLSSNPPLSLREILFLLLGQEKLTLAKEETLPLYSLLQEIPIGFQSFLSTILIEYLLNPLLSEISRILNLESIKVQYTFESFIPTWSRIIFEKKFSEDIIMKIEYSLEKGGFTSLELEYLLKSGLTIKWLTSGEGNDFFSFEYKVKF
ncbi:MAG: translocation/assembly module TamB domain-containing protein [Dictyoglomaceae bacterium]